MTAVHPGLTRTERTAARVAESAAAHSVSAELIERQVASGNSIGHVVDTSEVANVVAFPVFTKVAREQWRCDRRWR